MFTGIAVRVKDCSTVFVSLLGRDELALFVDQQNQTDYIKSTGELIDDCLSIEYFPANGTKVLVRIARAIRVYDKDTLKCVGVRLGHIVYVRSNLNAGYLSRLCSN